MGEEAVPPTGDQTNVNDAGPTNAEKIANKGVPAPRLTVEQLTEKVEELKKQIDKETTGFTGWVKWIGLIVALLAAILTVPKAAKDAYESFFARPETSVTSESTLAMTYDPTTKMLQFGFGFTISNNGKRKDTVQSLSAILKRIDFDKSSDLLTLGDNDFEFSENKRKIPNHFPISESTPREIDAFAKTYLDEQTKSAFLLPKSRWQLLITLNEEYGQKSLLKYCFDISQDDIDEIFNSQEEKTSQIRNPNCEGYSQ
jgi:hypothetical protein